MKRTTWGWLAIFFWFTSAIVVDSLQGLPDRIARHHAGILAPWAEYFEACFFFVAAVRCTTVWLRGYKLRHESKGQMNVS